MKNIEMKFWLMNFFKVCTLSSELDIVIIVIIIIIITN